MPNKATTVPICLAIAIILGSGPVTAVLPAHAAQEWTLAAVPAIKLKTVEDHTHHVEISSSNPSGTEMQIEKSPTENFAHATILQTWKPFASGDTFPVPLTDGETAFVRVKARNGKGVETAYSSLIKLQQKLTMPTLSSQSSTDSKVELTFNQHPATVYVLRSDRKDQHEISQSIFQDDGVSPATNYTYEYWAEDANGLTSDKNSVTIWTKPQEPKLRLKSLAPNGVVIGVETGANPVNVNIEAKRDGGQPKVTGKEIIENGLQPNTEYTYQARLKSENNEFTDWVPLTVTTSAPVADQPTDEDRFKEEVERVSATVSYTVGADQTSAYVDVAASSSRIKVSGEISGSSKALSEESARFSGLDYDRAYLLIVTFSDGEYSARKEYRVHTPAKPTSEEQEFLRRASELVGGIKYVTDGVRNSGRAWIDVTMPATSYKVTAVIGGETKQIGMTPIRFELDDNQEYSMYVVVSDGRYRYEKQLVVKTPNRTPPVVDSVYLTGSNIVVEVRSVTEIKQ